MASIRHPEGRGTRQSGSGRHQDKRTRRRRTRSAARSAAVAEFAAARAKRTPDQTESPE